MSSEITGVEESGRGKAGMIVLSLVGAVIEPGFSDLVGPEGTTVAMLIGTSGAGGGGAS